MTMAPSSRGGAILARGGTNYFPHSHDDMEAPSSRVEAPSSRVAARRDRTFFCIVGTLLAMAIVVYQGDYSGYKAALAERSAATENVFERGYKPPLQGHWCGNARHATCTPEDARVLHVAPGRRHTHVSR